MRNIPPLDEEEGALHKQANPAENVEGSYPRAEFFNAVQQEILNVITAAGLTPSATDLTQLSVAIGRIATASVDIPTPTDAETLGGKTPDQFLAVDGIAEDAAALDGHASAVSATADTVALRDATGGFAVSSLYADDLRINSNQVVTSLSADAVIAFRDNENSELVKYVSLAAFKDAVKWTLTASITAEVSQATASAASAAALALVPAASRPGAATITKQKTSGNRYYSGWAAYIP